MILHIFTKDLRKLWPWVLGFILILFYRALTQAGGPFPTGGIMGRDFFISQLLGGPALQLGRLLPVLNGAGLLLFFLVVQLVQLDPIPGDRQDWLVRPIRRRDLLVAKLLFVVLLFHAPMLAADLYEGLASGFPVGDILSPALSHNLTQLVTISLPAFAVGALTRNTGQALTLSMVSLVAAAALVFLIGLALGDGAAPPPAGAWVLPLLPLVAGAIVIIGLQYFRRATRNARIALAATLALVAAMQVLVLTGAAQAMAGLLSPAPQTALAVTFAPDMSKLPTRIKVTAIGGEEGRRNEQEIPGYTIVHLPLRVAGVPAGMMLAGGPVRAMLLTADGRPLLRDMPPGTLLKVPDATTMYLRLAVPKAIMDAGPPVRLELGLHLALLHPLGHHELNAIGGEARFADLGWCATQMGAFGSPQLQCRKAGAVPAGFSAQLFDAQGHPASRVRLDTPPGPERQDSVISRWGMTLGAGPFASIADMQAMPVAAKVVLTAYEPAGQSVLHLTIANLHLNDWSGDPP